MSETPPKTAASSHSEGHLSAVPPDEENKENLPAAEDEASRGPSAAKKSSHHSGSKPASVKSSGSKANEEEPPLTPDLTAEENPAADMRNLRRIIAENEDWNLATVPLLSDLCVEHIVQNFDFNSAVLHELNKRHKGKVLENIRPDLPVKITASLISDEGYWKRSCKNRWQLCDVSNFGGSWKRMYFERNLQEIIEFFVPESTDPTRLNEALPLSAPFVKRLLVRQLLPPVKEEPKEDDFSDIGSDAGDGPETDHFDFGPVISKLPNLVELRLCFGVRDCGMNFEWNLFQFTARDCLLLAKSVAACKQLTVFQLSRSRVDCDKCRVLISHMLDHPSLEELDLSHNSIGDRGARALGKFLNGHSRLLRMNVCDNQIRAAGAQAIAHALTKNNTLTHLNLRLNRLTDDGGQAICKALLKNSIITDANLAANEMTEPTAAILSQVVVQNKTLVSLDLSNNRLGPDGGKQLQEGMEDNFTITAMDLRFTECGQESEYCISQIIERNQEKKREGEKYR